uniref:PNPLA domain-containing protein n=1 Tax=Angiostrongylus cantonensis TaxID=6313 RepID=A0A0K0CSU4_ANGCA
MAGSTSVGFTRSNSALYYCSKTDVKPTVDYIVGSSYRLQVVIMTYIVQGFLPQDISPAQGRLFISVTKREERTNRLISQFSSRDDLLKCLMASCFIPLYSMGYGAEPPIIDDQACIDGGYTNNLPDFDDIRTITVSPFSGNAEISPADARNFFDWKMTVCNQTMNVNLKNIVRGAQALFPPSRIVLQNYYDMGYKDTLRFLIKHDIVQRPTGTEV